MINARWIVIVILMAVAGATRAQIQVIDQAQETNTVCMANIVQTDLAQSFQQSADNVSGAAVQIDVADSESGTVTIALYDNLPNVGGNLLATGTSGVVSGGDWATVFWEPVFGPPGTTLYLVFTGSNANTCLGGDIFNPYPFGQVYANPGFEPFPVFDYTFRTYRIGGDPIPALSLFGLVVLILLSVAVGAAALKRRGSELNSTGIEKRDICPAFLWLAIQVGTNSPLASIALRCSSYAAVPWLR